MLLSQPAATIAIVDDDVMIRQSLGAMITTLGMRSHTFSSAQEALSSHQLPQCHCAIIDVVMAEMDGLELQKHLRSTCTCLPVVLISGHANVSVVVTGMREGAVSFLEKPLTAEGVRTAVQEALAVRERWLETETRCRDLRSRLESLDAREQRVLQWILQDRPNRAMASELKVGLRTIDRIRSSVYEKLGVASAIGLANAVSWFDHCVYAADNVGIPCTDCESTHRHLPTSQASAWT